MNITGTSSADNLIGTSSDDSIMGLGGDDYLEGNDGADVLDGGTGVDTMWGGNGNDTYHVDDVSDVVYEFNGAGTDDSVISTVTYSVAPYATSGIENLYLAGTANINGTGNGLDNYIEGNSGNNVINGGAGADIMYGAGGSDTYHVDNAADEVYDFVGQGDYDAVVSSITYSLAPYGTSGVEELYLTGTTNINATGNGLDNYLEGNSGNNVINGGTGADTMWGAEGDDTYQVDNVGDVVYEFDVTGQGANDTVNSSVTYSLAPYGANGVENLYLTGTANINGTGNGLDNYIEGNSGANVIDGGAGADTMFGAAGDDDYYVDNASDVVYEFDGYGAEDQVYASASFSLDYFGGSGIENLYLTGTGNIDGTGNDNANGIMGNSGANVISGLGGDDVILSGAGTDVIDGGDGDDYLYGEADDDLIAGGAGNDYINGGSGHDDMVGGTGADIITGGDGDDILIGEDGNDSLTGGNGMDQLAGDAGNDTINGGVNADSYYFSGTFGSDVVTDADSATINYGTGANCDSFNFNDVDYDHLWFKQVGNNLEISVVGASDKVTVQNWFTSANNQIELVNDDSGHVLQSNQVANLVATMSSFSPQVLSGNGTLTTARDAAWI